MTLSLKFLSIASNSKERFESTEETAERILSVTRSVGDVKFKLKIIKKEKTKKRIATKSEIKTVLTLQWYCILSFLCFLL